jgi:hypothetical protein
MEVQMMNECTCDTDSIYDAGEFVKLHGHLPHCRSAPPIAAQAWNRRRREETELAREMFDREREGNSMGELGSSESRVWERGFLWGAASVAVVVLLVFALLQGIVR